MANFYAVIARYYDSEHHDKTEDLPLYTDLAADYGDPILIAGSGTGRLLLALAAEGHTVHGVEIEAAMFERAEQKRAANPDLSARLLLHHGDVQTVALDSLFRLIVVPYNTLMHFHQPTEQMALLRRLRSLVSADGALVIDLPNAGETFAAQDTEAVILERTFTDLDTGNLVMQQSVSHLDRAAQLLYVTWIYDEITEEGGVQRTFVPVVNRFFFAPEIRLLLTTCGFTVRAIYGDFDFAPFEDGCPRMIVVARPAAEA
ncbi:MAG: class I SAM-dependent methyltransferase [Chloroflexi bacterium]|nr:class I SAM-dependent methyltransferase [Chloroflexota bacterium]